MHGLDEHLESQANEGSDFKAGDDKPRAKGTKIKKAKMAKKILFGKEESPKETKAFNFLAKKKK